MCVNSHVSGGTGTSLESTAVTRPVLFDAFDMNCGEDAQQISDCTSVEAQFWRCGEEEYAYVDCPSGKKDTYYIGMWYV